MNSDSESLKNQFLSWLWALDATTRDDQSVEYEDISGAKNSHLNSAAFTSGDFESVFTPQKFQLGEIPTVQKRFQAVIKRRLQIEIQDHPPLFPWESQLIDYPEIVDNSSITLVPVWAWAAQQSQLNLPIPMPEKIFEQLLSRCQALVTSTQPLGAKLVQAVDSLFPQESHTLNELAGLVLRSPYRSVDSVGIPHLDDYSDLQPRQQMALSLLAAKELLENLTLPISITEPVVERQWLTHLGILNLKAEYVSKGQSRLLRAFAELPAAGSLKLYSHNSHVEMTSATSGSLNVELSEIQLNQTYTVSVELAGIDSQPLLFVIVPTQS